MTDNVPRRPGRRRAAWVVVLALGVAFAVADGRRGADQQIGVRWALASIRWYQQSLPALLPTSGATCRFAPTCSHYSHAVIERHGLWKGAGLTLGRLARCGPWTPRGTPDPPP